MPGRFTLEHSGLRRAVLIGALATGGAGACKSTGVQNTHAARLKTTETVRSLTDFCERGLDDDYDQPVTPAAACDCLVRSGSRASPQAVQRFCGPEGRAYHDHLRQTLATEAELVLTTNEGFGPTEAGRRCARNLAEFRISVAFDAVASACEKGDARAIARALDLPSVSPPESCWRLTSMTADGCIRATPCDRTTGADPGALPLVAPLTLPPGKARISDTIELCHTEIQKIHQLKDPDRAMTLYNYPFANFLTFGRTNATCTYGPANCHGTAQALAAHPLNQLPVTALTFHSPEVEASCGDLARKAYNAAASAAGTQAPRAGDLPNGGGGFVINMNHDTGCAANQCGTISFETFACDGGKPSSYVLANMMCIECWSKLLAGAGLHPMAPTTTWRDLKPGCVMTAQDHSITLLFANDGLCYYYESLSPFAAPQLNIEQCHILPQRFPRQWCPEKPLQFNARSLAVDLRGPGTSRQ